MKLLGSSDFQPYGPMIKYILLMAASNAFKDVFVLHIGMSWASVVGTVTGLRAGRSSFFDSSQRCYSSPECPDLLWSLPSLLFRGQWGTFFFPPTGKATGV